MAFQWDIDWDAIDRAKEELGLSFRINILPRAMRYSYGRYRGLEMGLMHTITVATDLGRRKTSMVLWHELTHAAQRERHGYAFHDMYDQQLIDKGLDPNEIEHGKIIPSEYREIAFEKEAFENEQKYRYRMLVKPRTSSSSRVEKSGMTSVLHDSFEEIFLNV